MSHPASASLHGLKPARSSFKLDLFQPIRNFLNTYAPQRPDRAKQLVKLIPAQCPFERDIALFGRTVAHIPPLCKLNPLYEELVMLRFKALCYLADECGEDISAFI
ncbi:MAG: Mo-dependent nitrogenase C-terminal domain-containing protein [Leptolyngbyaceae cyanobacterium T60_A2020_046]|nr:Mo-dependent nitrogenase C-terminal domain-containing protein [Leptolyngbyaceae cyanobacterium T60_A2020_046]